jgi:hypothetical protein
MTLRGKHNFQTGLKLGIKNVLLILLLLPNPIAFIMKSLKIPKG